MRSVSVIRCFHVACCAVLCAYCRPPTTVASFDNHIRACVADPANVAGAFTFGVNRSSFKRRCPVGVGTMEMFANFRAKHFLLPYGDQVTTSLASSPYARVQHTTLHIHAQLSHLTRTHGIPSRCQAMFMTRNRYLQVGPFPETVMMEDFELTRRIRRQAVAEGGRYVVVGGCLCATQLPPSCPLASSVRSPSPHHHRTLSPLRPATGHWCRRHFWFQVPHFAIDGLV